MLEMLENGCYRQYVIFFLCSMGDMILRCADDFISDVYEARPDSDPTPSKTILAIAVAITMAIAAGAGRLDSNCLSHYLLEMVA